jgi:hypothetical protein
LIQINQTSATAKQQHQHGGDVVTDTERQGLFRNPLKSLMKWIAQEAEKLADYVTGWSAPAAQTRASAQPPLALYSRLEFAG